MTQMIRAAVVTWVVFGLAGCAAQQASNRSSIPERNLTQCVALCDSAGMPLQSIVIVANQTGCVCGMGAGGGAEAAAGGAAVVAMVEAEAAAAAQSRQAQVR